MAILATRQLATLRREVEKSPEPIDYTKGEINAALQAIEDWWENNRLTLSTVIDNATAKSFTATQKRQIGRAWMIDKAARGG